MKKNIKGGGAQLKQLKKVITQKPIYRLADNNTNYWYMI